jgi:nucleotide-binding universal stress UspA family protein
MRSKIVVVAVSLEKETHRSLQQLKNMDLSPDAEIHLVHVVPVIWYARGMQLSVFKYPLEEERPRIEQAILAKLTAVKEELLPLHTNVTCRCLFDANEKAVFADYALKSQADLLIVASRNKHGLGTLFDSSFAQYQLRHSSANILILR